MPNALKYFLKSTLKDTGKGLPSRIESSARGQSLKHKGVENKHVAEYYAKNFVKAYVNIGLIYEYNNEPDKAIDNYGKAYEKMVMIKDKLSK